MKHSLKNTKNLLSRVSAHKRKIAFLLAIAIIIPHFSQIFMKWQERKEFLKQQEASQQEAAARDEDAAMARFSQYVDQSDYENALGEIDLLISVDQSNPQYYLKRAGLYVLLDRSNDALLDLDTALVLSPDLYDALQLRAQIYGENARYKEAAADYERMYKLDPEQKDVLMYSADCYQQMGDYEKAISAYDTAAEALPEYADAIAYARGVCFYSTENYEKAVTDLLQYLPVTPEDGELNFLIGSCYMNLKQENEAESYLLTALNGTSYLPETNFYLGAISMDKEDYEKAIPYFTTAIEGQCFTDFSTYNRGICYLNTGQTALAKEDFQYVTEHSEDTSLVSDSKDVLKTL